MNITITSRHVAAIIAGGVAFGWIMAATEFRPMLPLVKLIVRLGGAA